jgi:hypothetical protein
VPLPQDLSGGVVRGKECFEMKFSQCDIDGSCKRRQRGQQTEGTIG